MKKPTDAGGHQASRMIVDPLRLFDCSLVTDGAVVVLWHERGARPRHAPARCDRRHAGHPVGPERVHLRAAQPRHQSAARGESVTPRERDMAVYRIAPEWTATRPGLLHLRRLLAAGPLRAGALRLLRPGRGRAVGAGRPHRLGGELPVNTSGGPPVGSACLRLELDLLRWSGSCAARPGHGRSRARRACNGARAGAIPSSFAAEKASP